MTVDDRERSFENALARRLRPGASHAACSDAETLAAYHEKSLAPAMMTSLKTHISECARCQEILAQLQATDEIPLPAGIAGPETAQSKTAQSKTAQMENTRSKAAAATAGVRVIPARRATPWRWVAPSGALAAGLLVWLAVHENDSGRFAKAPSRSDAQPTEVAKAEPPPASPLPPPSLDATNSEQVPADTFSPSDAARSRSSIIAPVPEKKSQSIKKEKGFANATKPSSSAVGVGGGFANGAVKLETPSAPAPVLQPTPPRGVTQTVTVAPGLAPADMGKNQGTGAELAKGKLEAKSAKEKQDGALSRSDSPASANGDVTRAPAPAPSLPQSSESMEVTAESTAITAPPAYGRAVTDLKNLNQRASVLLAGGGAPVTVSAPDGRASWRIGPAGVILFSSNAGKTWLVQPSGIITDLVAGSAPSGKVCWIVGRSGTILRTTDKGKHWKKVTPPTQDDFRAVFAVNARQATVSPATGTYQTIDGGTTWKKLPPE